MNESEDNEIDRRLAIAALAMDTESVAKGLPPEHDELWDFIHGAVTDRRRAEILSHLADNEELFSQWHSLIVTIDEFPEPTAEYIAAEIPDTKINRSEARGDHMAGTEPASTATWWQRLINFPIRLPLVSTGIAAAIVGILILSPSDPSKDAPMDFWTNWSQPISTSTESADPALRADLDALLAGVRDQLIALNYAPLNPNGELLPEHIPACSEGENFCTIRREALFQLGLLVVGQLHDCRSPTKTAAPGLSDPAIASRSIVEQNLPVLLVAPLKAWISAHGQDQFLACEAAANFLGQALHNE